MMNYLFRRIKKCFCFNSYTPVIYFTSRVNCRPPRLSIKRKIQKYFQLGPYKPIRRFSHKIIAKDFRPTNCIREVHRMSFEERSEAHFKVMCDNRNINIEDVRSWCNVNWNCQPEELFKKLDR
jgi:hypothetical protein